MGESEPRSFPLWPLLALPAIALVAVVAWFAVRPGEKPQEGPATLIPSLGGGARPLSPPVDTTAPDEADPATPADTDPAPADTDAPPESSADLVDTLLGRLAHAVKSNNARGIQVAHEGLRQCRPAELVDRRVTAALESEPNAFVRTETFRAFHTPAQAYAWALRVLGQRSGKFNGTDSQLDPGENLELIACLESLLEHGLTGPDRDVVALVRGLLENERPEWALSPALSRLSAQVLAADRREVAAVFQNELKAMLERASAEWDVRELAFALFAQAQPDLPALFALLEAPALRPYVATLLAWFGPRGGQGADYPLHARVRAAAHDVAALCANILQGQAPEAEKQRLIERIAAGALPAAFEQLIIQGVQRRDRNLPDYLAALGRITATASDVALLSEAAASADARVSAGALEGLRRCALPQAALELQRLVEQGDNPGLQSQALGALLSRDAAGAAQLIESYLAPERDPAVRAVAVAHIPAADVERLKKVVEDDPAPRVRGAALTRLGEMKDKKLLNFFTRIQMTERNLLLAQQARKYADELKNTP